ncbi:MAG: helix-turn-helix domain-containing protein [Mesorhizobium sp.]|nr:helix-turn-helix domain-containing protein [Mesorhizobium sp.]MCO5085107.1 helix-turn-helix domain-containing protein [Rhizobiaceae bacterium]MCO5164639.1 helix-turn-helix domain-containing protein [Mesorhizobium sp.]
MGRKLRTLRLLRTGLITAEELAKHLRVSTRTVYRDIKRLKREGQPIHGEAGVGYLLKVREVRHVG